MKNSWNLFTSLLFAALCVASTVGVSAPNVAAATRDDDTNTSKYVVSAKAGGINFVSGRAERERETSKGWKQLSAKDSIAEGDRVRTARDGRFEMLLTPGSYLRVGGDAEFEFTDSAAETLSIVLRRGSVIVEAFGTGGDAAPLLTLDTPHTRIAILRDGIYRINAVDGSTEIIVTKGRAMVGGLEAVLVKGGRKIVVERAANAAVVPAKFEKRERDEFDLWSKERAEELAKVNRRLSGRALRSALTGFSYLDTSFGWNARCSGIWVFDSFRNSYTFVPFGWYGRSPYGGGYSTSFGYTGGLYGGGRYYPISGGGGGGRIGTGNNGGNGSGNGGNNSGGGGISQPRVDPPRDSGSGRRLPGGKGVNPID